MYRVCLSFGCFDYSLCPVANGEAEVIPNQAAKSLKHPEQYALALGTQLFRKIGIINAVFGSIFYIYHHLAAVKGIAAVVLRSKCSVAEAQESGVKMPLDALYALALDVDLILIPNKKLLQKSERKATLSADAKDFCRNACISSNLFGICITLLRDQRFYDVGLGQCLYLHIVVEGQQLELEVGSGEAVDLYLLQAAGVHTVAEQLAKHTTDARLALAALADKDKHLLGSGGRYEQIAHVLLQGRNVLLIEQLGQELQPAFGSWCIGVVLHRKPIHTERFVQGESVLQKVGSVGYMDSVLLNGQRVAIARHLDRLQQKCRTPCRANGCILAYHVVDVAAYALFVLDGAVHREQSAENTPHGMLLQVLLVKDHINDLVFLKPFGLIQGHFFEINAINSFVFFADILLCTILFSN